MEGFHANGCHQLLRINAKGTDEINHKVRKKNIFGVTLIDIKFLMIFNLYKSENTKTIIINSNRNHKCNVVKLKLPSEISYSEENIKHVKPTLIKRSLKKCDIPFLSITRIAKKPDSKKNKGIRQLLTNRPIMLIHSWAGAILSIP